MATQDKLKYLKETKNGIKEAILLRGGDISNSDTFRSYAEKIEAIEPISTPLSPCARDLFLWLDAKENGPYGTHSSDTRWYTLAGSTFGSQHEEGSNYSYYKNASPYASGIKWYKDHVSITENRGFQPYNPTYCRMPSRPIGFTVEAVVAFQPGVTDQSNELISSQESGGFALYLITNKDYLRTRVYLLSPEGTRAYHNIDSDEPLEYGVKYYINSSFDQNTGVFKLRVINTANNMDISKSFTLGGHTLEGFHKAPVCIGYDPDGSGTIKGGYFRGDIYSIRVYKRALTEQEEADNIAFEKARYNF